MDMAEALNLGCLCSTLERQRLHDDLRAHEWWPERPHLFSSTPVFMTSRDFLVMERAVSALHRVSALPGYQAQALQRTGDGSALPGPDGVFMGYDFHLTDQGPRLIEINTNAGGAFLHAAAVRAHRACCESVQRRYNAPTPPLELEASFVAMFRAEWQAERGALPLRTVAIVDDEPAAQYLAPEFELARAVFESNGIAAVVADPRELQWREGALRHPGLPDGGRVDLVYNRLTDFDLSDPAHAALRSAYLARAAVVTPNPRAHALHADKRNLVALADDSLLAAWGAGEEDRAVLRAVVPATQLVTAERADALWAQRRHLFFKPATGYGSKAAFRGDKLTRRVWGEILAGGFVAQALVPPSERVVDVAGTTTRLKLDVRAYAYGGRIQLLAARTYSGQTTNFRTAGGGFSPVVVLPATHAPAGTCSSDACVEQATAA
jgi:hypothetical protein